MYSGNDYPKTRHDWWKEKLHGNTTRDLRNCAALRKLGWRVITVWEYETVKPEKLMLRLARLLLEQARGLLP